MIRSSFKPINIISSFCNLITSFSSNTNIDSISNANNISIYPFIRTKLAYKSLDEDNNIYIKGYLDDFRLNKRKKRIAKNYHSFKNLPKPFSNMNIY